MNYQLILIRTTTKYKNFNLFPIITLIEPPQKVMGWVHVGWEYFDGLTFNISNHLHNEKPRQEEIWYMQGLHWWMKQNIIYPMSCPFLWGSYSLHSDFLLKMMRFFKNFIYDYYNNVVNMVNITTQWVVIKCWWIVMVTVSLSLYKLSSYVF